MTDALDFRPRVDGGFEVFAAGKRVVKVRPDPANPGGWLLTNLKVDRTAPVADIGTAARRATSIGRLFLPVRTS